MKLNNDDLDNYDFKEKYTGTPFLSDPRDYAELLYAVVMEFLILSSNSNGPTSDHNLSRAADMYGRMLDDERSGSFNDE